MNRTRLVITTLALGCGLVAASAARAHSGADVQWSVTIGSPGVAARMNVPPPVRIVHPVIVVPRPVVYRPPTRWDLDGDGIPNRYDRVYNPRWDVDGDGIPNRYDPHRWGRGHGHRDSHGRDHHGAPRHDHDRDGVPERADPYPHHPRRGR